MKIRIPAPDLHCPSCSLLVAALREELPGVTRLQADLDHGLVEADFDETLISAQQIESALQNRRRSPPSHRPVPGTLQAAFPVTGMSCTACATLISHPEADG
jgi:copper chaperone CopZ